MGDPVTMSMAATGAGGVLSTVSQLAAAKNAKNISRLNAANLRKTAEYNAGIAEQAAGQEEAASQLRAQEAKRQGRLMQSRVLALAAASGGSTLDADVMNAIAGFEKEGDLAARTELYEGSEAARLLRTKGALGIYEAESAARNILYQGKAQARQHKVGAASTIMGSTSSMASKYGEYKG